MYLPSGFHETRTATLHAFIRRHSFATLISPGGAEGIQVSHLPMLLDRSRTPNGMLVGHLAKPNPQWREFTGNGATVTASFAGPHAYISPRWYQTRAAVPTWNYANVYVQGTARVIEDRERLSQLLKDLSDVYEGGNREPWSLADLPAQMHNSLIDGIVGIEIEIASIDGKFKLSQNRIAADRHGVIQALGQSESYEDRAVGELMSEYLKAR